MHGARTCLPEAKTKSSQVCFDCARLLPETHRAFTESSMGSSASPAFSVRCYCGAVALDASAAPRGIVNCHCGQCRRLSGAAFTTWVSFRSTSILITGNESLTAFPVTTNVTRHFCRVCGSHVFTSDIRLPKVLGVPAGVIAGAPLTTPSAHYFVSHKASWHAICDGLPRFGGESGVEPPAA
ncbi:GFA family protein [Roseateles sp.]|uniref:GFA family protein n=1 Tax=Roseateles sp. TaxID=1971397 RepID=UPI00387E7317